MFSVSTKQNLGKKTRRLSLDRIPHLSFHVHLAQRSVKTFGKRVMAINVNHCIMPIIPSISLRLYMRRLNIRKIQPPWICSLLWVASLHLYTLLTVLCQEEKKSV